MPTRKTKIAVGLSGVVDSSVAAALLHEKGHEDIGMNHPFQDSSSISLGTYSKQQVRKIAESIGLETAIRPESQDFIAGGDYSTLFNNKEIRKGDIVDDKGNTLGKHRGIIHYTVGQRKGLGIASDRPLYVVKIDPENKRLEVSDRESLFSEGLIAKDLNLIAIDLLDRPYKTEVKIRLKQKAADATVFPYERNEAKILFKKPQMSVTPGQSAVFYSDNNVLGGGIIEKAL